MTWEDPPPSRHLILAGGIDMKPGWNSSSYAALCFQMAHSLYFGFPSVSVRIMFDCVGQQNPNNSGLNQIKVFLSHLVAVLLARTSFLLAAPSSLASLDVLLSSRSTSAWSSPANLYIHISGNRKKEATEEFSCSPSAFKKASWNLHTTRQSYWSDLGHRPTPNWMGKGMLRSLNFQLGKISKGMGEWMLE